MTKVSICIATYKRPEGLSALLDSIDSQQLNDDVQVEVIVVDNAPPAAHATVASFAPTGDFSVQYLQQPEQNIALTRNAAVEAATGDYIWFVDDDEVAQPRCLQRLIDAAHRFNADVVYGPVIPKFEGPIENWIRALHSRPVNATGTPSRARRTGNTLVRAEALAMISGPFHESYGRTGGEDSLLFRQLEARGLKLIDSEDAIAIESVPAERSSWEWIRTRKRRLGSIYGSQTVHLAGSKLHLSVFAVSAKAAIQIVGWAVAATMNLSDHSKRSEYILRLWTNIGKLEGIARTQPDTTKGGESAAIVR